ncbi:MAG TPA: DMT family transporter [Fibrobacteria bacterium]|nr:DMT family transporter [Fibrobacteria bacterium]
MASQTDGRNLKLGISAVVAASILFSAKSVFFKLCYRYGTAPVVLQTLRGAFSLPFYLIPFALMRLRSADRRPAAMSGKDMLTIAWLGFSGYYLASIFDMVGLQYVSAGTERLILFVYPTLVVLFSAWIFRKRIPRAMLIPLLLSYAGIALSFGGEAGGGAPGGRPLYGGFLVFLSAVFYALFLVGQGRMVHRFGPQRLAEGCMMASSACVFVQYLICYPWRDALSQPAQVYWIAGLTSVFCNVLPIYLYGYGVHKVGAGKAAVVSSVGPVSTLVLAGTLLGERAGALQLAGLALVVAGTLRLGMAKAGPAPVQEMGVSAAAEAPAAASPAAVSALKGRGLT